MNAAPEESKGGQQAGPSSLDKLEQAAKIFATAALPVIVALGGWWIQSTIENDKQKAAKIQQEQQSALEYVKIAKEILTSTEKDIPEELTKWSWRLLNGVAPVKFEQADLDRLIANKERIPTPSATSLDFMSLGPEYDTTFKNMRITNAEGLKAPLESIIANKERYEAVENTTHVPWYVVGILHYDRGFDFDSYLGNGDPLTAPTVHIPKGRGPFSTWEDGARDALKLAPIAGVTDWNVDRILYELERYNGFGYRRRGINSPYLWSCASPYIKGAFRSDGIFDAQTVASKCGAAPLIKSLIDRKIVTTK